MRYARKELRRQMVTAPKWSQEFTRITSGEFARVFSIAFINPEVYTNVGLDKREALAQVKASGHHKGDHADRRSASPTSWTTSGCCAGSDGSCGGRRGCWRSRTAPVRSRRRSRGCAGYAAVHDPAGLHPRLPPAQRRGAPRPVARRGARPLRAPAAGGGLPGRRRGAGRGLAAAGVPVLPRRQAAAVRGRAQVRRRRAAALLRRAPRGPLLARLSAPLDRYLTFVDQHDTGFSALLRGGSVAETSRTSSIVDGVRRAAADHIMSHLDVAEPRPAAADDRPDVDHRWRRPR